MPSKPKKQSNQSNDQPDSPHSPLLDNTSIDVLASGLSLPSPEHPSLSPQQSISRTQQQQEQQRREEISPPQISSRFDPIPDPFADRRRTSSSGGIVPPPSIGGSGGIVPFGTPEPTLTMEEERRNESLALRRMFSHMGPEKVMISIGLFFLMVASICTLCIPMMIGRLIDKLKVINAALDDVKFILIATLVILTINGISSYIHMCLLWISGDRVVARVRKQLFTSIIYREIGFFDSVRTGELVSRISTDVNALNTALTTEVAELCQRVAILVGAISYMFYLSWDLTLVALAVAPIVGFIGHKLARQFHKFSKQVNDELSLSTIVAEETIGNIRTVRALSREPTMQNRYNEKIDSSFKLNRKMKLMKAFQRSFVYYIGGVCVVGVLWYGSYKVIQEVMTGGELLTFILFGLQVGERSGQMLDNITLIKQAAGACQKVLQIIEDAKSFNELYEAFCDVDPDHHPVRNRRHDTTSMSVYNLNRSRQVNEHGHFERLDTQNNPIRFENVYFHYPSRPDQMILKGLNLSVNPGEKVAFVGTSGGGKSTVIALLEQFYKPVNGRIMLGDLNILNINPVIWRSSISYVQQNCTLFCCSIRDNVLMSVNHRQIHNCEETCQGILDEIKQSVHSSSGLGRRHRQLSRDRDGVIIGEPSSLSRHFIHNINPSFTGDIDDLEIHDIQCDCHANYNIPLCQDAFGQEYTMNDVILACKQANAHDFILGLSDGYNTLVGERGTQLSGGQRQRIAIASAIIANAPILLLDEASSALDSESERLVQESLDKLMVNKTVIMVAHRLSTIKNVDRILCFHGGVVVESGTHYDLMKKRGMFYRLVQMQQLVQGGGGSGGDDVDLAMSPDLSIKHDDGNHPYDEEKTITGVKISTSKPTSSSSS